MSLRARILLFLAALIADAVFITRQPWSMVVACAAYLLIVFPALRQ